MESFYSIVTAYLPVGRLVSYVASKYGVRGLMEALNDEMYFDGLQNEIHTTTVFPCFMNTRKEVINTLQKLEWVFNGTIVIEYFRTLLFVSLQYSIEDANFFDQENSPCYCQWHASEPTPRVHAQICGPVPDTLWVSYWKL